MSVTKIAIPILIVLLAAGQVHAEPGAGSQTDVWRAFAEKLEPGAFVTVRLKDGSRIKGHLILVSPEALEVKPKTRVAVPLRAVPLDAIASIERQREGMSPGAKVMLGVGVGAATLLVLAFMVILSSD